MTIYSQHANRGKTQILAAYQGSGGVVSKTVTSVSETLCVPEGFRLFGRGVAVCRHGGVRTSG